MGSNDSKKDNPPLVKRVAKTNDHGQDSIHERPCCPFCGRCLEGPSSIPPNVPQEESTGGFW